MPIVSQIVPRSMNGSFVIATWNCFGQGQGFLDALTANRAPYGERLSHDEVTSTLASANVVCIQEVLSKDAETFFDGLGSARVRDHNGAHLASATLRGSGLGIASRHPLSSHRLAPFGGPRVGWDRLARKGTLHARMNIDGVEIDVLTAHMQSGYDSAAVRVRAWQIEALGRRVAELGSDGRPFIVAGDFNVCGLESNEREYESLCRALPDFEDLGAASNLPTFDPHPERNSLAHEVEPDSRAQRLDYLFVRSARRGAQVRARSVGRILDRPIDSKGESVGVLPARRPIGARAFASDHFGLAASLEFA